MFKQLEKKEEMKMWESIVQTGAYQKLYLIHI